MLLDMALPDAWWLNVVREIREADDDGQGSTGSGRGGAFRREPAAGAAPERSFPGADGRARLTASDRDQHVGARRTGSPYRQADPVGRRARRTT
jgi:hypothetical protein